MDEKPDVAQVVVHPPLALAITLIAGLALDRFLPLSFLPPNPIAGWVGLAIILLALGLAIWAIATMQRAGATVPTNEPTATIVDSGPYGFSRNPIYLGMFLFLAGLAVALDNPWFLVLLVPFALVIHFGVVDREEAYLERKFGDVYRSYRSRVRRWL